jgi:hypothetical protein
VRSHRRALDRTRAALLAEAVANQTQAELRQAPADVSQATHPDFPGFYYDVTFTPFPANEHYYEVRVVVRWGDKNAPVDERNSETYETVLQQKSY